MLQESHESLMEYIKSYQERKYNKKRKLKNLKDIIEENSKQTFAIIINENQNFDAAPDQMMNSVLRSVRESMKEPHPSKDNKKKDDYIERYLQACENIGDFKLTQDNKIERRFDLFDLYMTVSKGIHKQKRYGKKSHNKTS